MQSTIIGMGAATLAVAVAAVGASFSTSSGPADKAGAFGLLSQPRGAADRLPPFASNFSGVRASRSHRLGEFSGVTFWLSPGPKGMCVVTMSANGSGVACGPGDGRHVVGGSTRTPGGDVLAYTAVEDGSRDAVLVTNGRRRLVTLNGSLLVVRAQDGDRLDWRDSRGQRHSLYVRR